MKTAYLLPCSCGRNCEVDAGQAGSQIVCTCGQTLPVPSIRGLRQFEMAAAADAKPKGALWSPVRGAIFSASLFLAAAAAILAGYQGYWFYITTRHEDPAAVQLELEYEHIGHLRPDEVMQVFRQEEREGLGEQNPPHWLEIDAKHEASRRWGIAWMVVAGAGLLAAAGAMVGLPKRTS